MSQTNDQTRFTELTEQIAKLYAIAPGSKYLIVIKGDHAASQKEMAERSAMAQEIMGVFENRFQAPAVVLIVDDPANDVRVLEMK